jgi:amino acid adenylation domain-containing protein
MVAHHHASFLGKGPLLVRCAEEWRAAGYAVDAVYSDDAAVHAWAARHQVPAHPAIPPSSDFLFVVGEPPERAADGPVRPRRAVIAYQDSPLPAYAGWHATTWALLNGETTHGVTWYQPDGGAGRCIARADFDIAPEDTVFSLDARCFDAALDAFRRLLSAVDQDPLPALPERDAKPSFHAVSRRPPGAGVIDFTQSADRVTALVRALDFGDRLNPLAMPKVSLGTMAVRVGGAVRVPKPAGAVCGEVLHADARTMTIAAKDAAVRFESVTRLDGAPANAADVVQRAGLKAGAVVPSLPPDVMRALTDLHEALAPHEAFWAARLAALEPFVWPFPVPSLPDGAPEWKRKSIALSAAPADLQARIAQAAAFFARLCGARAFDLGYCPARGAEPVPAAALVAPVVPFHVELPSEPGFAPLRARVEEEWASVREHRTFARDLPLRLRPAPAAPRLPVCLAVGDGVEPADADLMVCFSPDGSSCEWRYDARVLPDARVEQLAALFARVVDALQADAVEVLAIPLLDQEAEARARIEGAARPYPAERDVWGGVDAHARTQPEAVAIRHGATAITYRELEQQSNRMAAFLRARGVGPDARVGLLMERAPETMVALLGVLKAGGCYVPLDPHFPPDRLAFMMEQAKLSALLVQPAFRPLAPATSEPVVVDAALKLLSDESAAPPPAPVDPGRLLYVIYTSGSTGRPKGVAMTRRAGLNLIAWQNSVSTPDPRGPTLQYASLGFDVSFQEIFSTWTAGGTLVIVPEDMRRDPMQLLRLARQERIARWFMPYAALQQVAVSAAAAETWPEHLADVITAGEALRITPEIRRFFARLPACRLHNQYGPSETHVATACVLPPDPEAWPALPPIGEPIANTRIVLLDSSGQPAPRGFRGELYIGGDCLARGYLDQPALTQERFVERAWGGHPPERYYRTGDLAVVNAQGQLEFLGRGDDQVKIRGYRVELGEVEAALSRHPAVRECAVVAREQGGVRQLVAYVVPGAASADAAALRGHLQAALPDYMVPSFVVFLDRIPLTPSGKIHRRALPAPPVADGAEDRPPRNEVEQILARLWQQALGVERVGTSANFFDLGGDSLKLARVQAGLRASLKREVSILDLFRFPTIAGLAEFLAAGDAAPRATKRRRAVDPGEPIALVGLAGRFPGADSVEQFWTNLCEGRESITFFKDEEVPGAPPPDSGLKFVKARGVLERCEWFDAALFGYGPREAELMDPQHRVFLETAWEALESAACDPARFDGAIGVFAACSLNTYLLYNALADRASVEEFARAFQVGGYQTLMGNDKDYVATRVAYKLNLRGPSMTVQTACSSSLVAVCEACQSLAAGACDVALAGGVSISFPQQRGYLFVEGSIASSDGHCRPFDASATGTVFGAGAGVVVLKRLSDAQADGDTIYAVLKGWALNNDGARKAGYMAPSAEGQAEVVLAAQERAGVDARTIGLVETHGTGTPIGDPIEVAGLTRAFRRHTADTGFCALGAVKANIGHLEAAAGVTGLIKAALALHHRQLPPVLHFERPNPLLELPQTPFFCPRELMPWPGTETPRRAAVSSFGVGGTNAHVVLEEAPSAPAASSAKSVHLLPLSARTDAALSASAARLADHLERASGLSLADAAYTLQVGRQTLARRGFVVATSADEAVAALRSSAAFRRGQPLAGAPSVIFLFPGQGSQHVDMGRGLYETEPVFKTHLDECAAILAPLLGVELRSFLFPPEAERAVREAELTRTRFAQPFIFSIEYALARWWKSLGLDPAAMIGHSAGEYVAACLAGVFTLPDALALLVKRAQLMQDLPPGRMLAVRLPEDEIRPLLPSDVSIAGCNAPALTVVSGPTGSIEHLARQLEEKGIGAKALQTSHAFHSAMMDPALEPFRRAVEATPRRPAGGRFLSTLAGGWISPEAIAAPDYWVRQIREPVRFSAALREAMQIPNAVFLEVGPSQALTTLAAQHDDPAAPVTAVASMRHAKEGLTDEAALLRAVGRLWCSGVAVDWYALHGSPLPRRVPLPAYPFERKRYWIEPPASAAAGATSTALAPASEEVESSPAPAEAAPGDRSPEAVLNEVLDILQDLSGIERANIEPARPFLEMGFDSLFLTQVSLAFQRRFLVKLTLRQMLDELSSPAAIAGHLAQHMPAHAGAPTAAAPVIAPPAPAKTAGDATSITQPGPFAPEETAAAKPAPSVPTRHGPYAPINKSAGDALTPRQQEHLDALIARYTKKTQGSKEYTRRNRAHFADPRAVAGFRVTWKEMTYPVVAARSAGSRIWDIDGNEFLDVTMGFGTNLFGHNPEFIRKALERQLGVGLEIGPQSALAGAVAQDICVFTGMDRVTFCNTGSEAVMGAVRSARTVTGRQRIVYFAGDYHGVNDEVLAKGQTLQGRMRSVPIAPGIPPDMVSQVIVLSYGDPASLETIRAQAATIAAVLVEPVQSRKPQLQPRDFLHALRALTRETGIALIFDEVITGFRVHPGGAQAWFGIQADLTTYGKVIGGGMPIGVIAGRREYMDAFDGGMWSYGDASVPEAGVTFFAGTFVRHPLAMAGARAVLDHLKAAGPALQTELNERTARFAEDVNAFMVAEGIELRINTFGSLWYFSHGDSFTYFSLMFHFLRDLGVHIWEGRPCFLSTAHTDADVARLVEAFKQAMRAMREGGFLPAPVALIPESGPFPLSEAQQEIWLASRLDPASAPAFNESCSFTFRGAFNQAAMERALQQVVDRHEALRTSFDPSGGMQTVHASARMDVQFRDLSAMEAGAREQALAELVRAEVSQSFDLAQVPLVRARIARMEADRHVLVLTAHHIVCDGWSYDVMARDLSALYSLACAHAADERPPPTQFRDYARYLAGYRRDARAEADLAYWLGVLADPPSAIDLPTDRTRPAQRTFNGAMEVAVLEEPLVGAIKELGARKRCTLFANLLAHYAALLHRLTGQTDLIIGVPAAGQQLMESGELVGHCANLLPVRLRIDPERPFSDLLAAAQRGLLDAYEHQGLTFGDLLKALQVGRDPSRPPLIQVTFNVDPAIHGLEFAQLETGIVINPRTAYQFEHSLNIVAGGDRLRIECNYNTDLFDEATVRRWLGYFRRIAQTVSEDPDLPLAALSLLPEEERQRVVMDWNRTATPYPARCIHELFEEQAAAGPDRIALSMQGRTVTYGALNAEANQLARRLIEQGVRPDQPVGLCAERSLEMVTGLLAILKAGGAYLPLDPTHPRERLRMQVEDARLTVVLAQAKHAPLLAGLPVATEWLDDAASAWRSGRRENLSPEERAAAHQPAQLAYVLYTSGSTGQPKGVLIEHKSVVRLVKNVAYVALGPEERLLHLSPLAFDASTFELWGALLNGARLAILPPGPFSIEQLERVIAQERTSVLWLTAGLFHTVVDERPSALGPVKQLLTGGEAPSGRHIARLLAQRPDLTVINGYGPTESTTFATSEAMTHGQPVGDPPPLGRPISNTQVYVLDARLQPQPVGVPGELCIGGDGLARGYLNRPELTEAAFVPNPLPGTPGDRLYRSGDLARWRADGKLEFLGRRDAQVKIRGFRIEPGEIEAVLSAYPGLQSCAVVVRNAPNGDKQLVAFVAPAAQAPNPEVDALREHLRARLPEFMVPSLIVVQRALPLNASGKVDRRALAAHPVEAGSSSAPSGAAPSGARETALADAWKQVLGVTQVRPGDDFFAMGGHSLAALKLINRLRDAGYALDVADLFRNPTVERLSAVLVPLARETAAVTAPDSGTLIRLRDVRPGHPALCLLPSDFGDLLIYSNLLPHFDGACPVVGLQCPSMHEDDRGIRSMHDLAAWFVRELRAVQPRGPYLLAGYCFGGHVAIEMARQLRQAGERIGMLSLIDARPFNPKTEDSEYLRMRLHGALRARPTDWRRHLAAKWSMWREGQLIDAMARRNPGKLDRRDLNRWVLETRVLQHYRSTEYPGAITFFYPEESQYELYGDPSCGWLNLAARVYLHKVTGSHLNMMKEPHAALLANRLGACVRQALGEGGP